MRRLVITGGTGSLGTALVERIVGAPHEQIATTVIVVSRDEVKSGDMAERFPDVRCQLGDVRDYDRMLEVFRGADAVVHAAALKRVTHSVYSPGEMVKTNVEGTRNVIRAATEADVRRVLVVSSDKAVEATNLYGKTKAMAEDYAVQANSYTYPRGTLVSCVRYGNVLGSRGSIVPLWRSQIERGGALTITHPEMTRFVITMPQAVQFIVDALRAMEGGEIFVPVLPAATVRALAEAVWFAYGPGGDRGKDPISTPRLQPIGVRPGGEKMHEALLSREEPMRTWQTTGTRLTVLPTYHSWRESWDLRGWRADRDWPSGYTSDAAVRMLGARDLLDLLETVP